MEQFIGCDAQKKFSVLVAVNEKGHAGEALRVAHVLARGPTGAPVNRCGPCRLQFFDWRLPRPGAKLDS